MRSLQLQYVIELKKELEKVKSENVEMEEIFAFIEDILRYFDNEEDEEYETNQLMIGIQELSQGYIVKVSKGVNFSCKKYREINEMAMKICIQYYVKY